MRDTAEAEALLLLRLLPGLGDHGASELLRRHGAARKVLAEPGVIEAAAGPTVARALGDPALRVKARELLERSGRMGLGLLGLTDPGYPPRLLDLHDPPPLLFLRGHAELLARPMVTIVGSRRATGTGRRVAERLARDLSLEGVTVVSGLALGIDGSAHRGALEGPGSTVAVMARGPDRAYPVAHGPLFRQIARSGLLLSEFPPGEGVRRYHFPRRNRILAALSAGVVVVEAGSGGGAMITVEHATDLGRDVMCVPGSPEHPQNAEAHRMIRDGACLVTEAAHVFSVLGWERAGEGSSPALTGPEGGQAWEAQELARLHRLLGPAPLQLEDVLEGSGLPAGRALALLTRLELQGRARRDPEGWLREGR